MQATASQLTRRLLPLALLIPALIIGSQGTTTIRAQTGPATATPKPSPTARPSPPPIPTPIPSPTRIPTPLPSIDPSHFALSRWEFPPPAALLNAQIESTQQADADPFIPQFGSTYAAEGRLTGYYMNTGTPNYGRKGTLHAVYTYYLTSTFATLDAATAAFTQLKSGWDGEVTVPPAGVTAQLTPMTVGAGDVSSGGLYTETRKASNSNDIFDESEVFFKRGIYLVEIFQQSLHKDASYATVERPYLLTIAHQLDSVASGAVAGPPAPTIPSKPELHILSTRFEPGGLRIDFGNNLKRAPLTKVTAGTSLQASTYFEVSTAPPNSHFTVHIKITRGKFSLKRAYSYPLGAYPPGYYRQDMYGFSLTVAGRYTLTTRVNIGHVTRTRTATLTVSKHAFASSRLKPGMQLARDPGTHLATSIIAR